MPELPEVETVRLGLVDKLTNRRISKIIFHCNQLRYPIDNQWKKMLAGQQIVQLSRRGKYLLFHFKQGGCIWHLGMSGSLCLVNRNYRRIKHDHIDIHFDNGKRLIYNDPRRFGLFLVSNKTPEQHSLLQHLGPEPLTDHFNHHYLAHALKGKKSCIKQAIMDNRVVVGVGNIYASESLFRANISPLQAAYQLSDKQCKALVEAVKITLEKAINAGGSSLKDFVNSEGKPGYFQQQLFVYNRTEEACYWCESPIVKVTLSGRSTFYCPSCQRNIK
jgi:formamidopyrimidine-DNA glycosylase